MRVQPSRAKKPAADPRLSGRRCTRSAGSGTGTGTPRAVFGVLAEDDLTRHEMSAELAETCEPSAAGDRLRGMRRVCRRLVTEGGTGGRPDQRHGDPRASGAAGSDPHRRRDRSTAEDLRRPAAAPGPSTAPSSSRRRRRAHRCTPACSITPSPIGGWQEVGRSET